MNPRHARAARVTASVCVCVCVSISQHLMSGVSVHFENTVTYSMGSEGQNDQGNFSEPAPLQRSSTSYIAWLSSAISRYTQDRAHAFIIIRGAKLTYFIS